MTEDIIILHGEENQPFVLEGTSRERPKSALYLWLKIVKGVTLWVL